jgi:multiple sugar transport system permease protein
MGKASAIAWIMFLIALILTAINFALSDKWVYYEGGDDQ